MNLVDLERFHQDLKAAIAARVPIQIFDKSNRSISASDLARLEQDVTPILSNRDTSELSTDSFGFTKIPQRYLAAIKVFDRTKTMLPVFDGLTAKGAAQRQVARMMRGAFGYLVLLLLVAILGLAIFAERVLPLINRIRFDTNSTRANQTMETLGVSFVLPWLIGILGVGLVLLLIWIALGGTNRISMWLGGRNYVRCCTSSAALRTTNMLLAAGEEVNVAAALSCELVGADKRVVYTVVSLTNDLPEQNNSHLETLADHFMGNANRRLSYMKATAPIVIVTIFGGAITLVYCLTIFTPIVWMIKDLTTAGT